MYIPDFVCGVIVGVLATFGGLVAWSAWLNKKHRNS